MGTGRRPKSPASETKDFFAQGAASSMSFSQLSDPVSPHRPASSQATWAAQVDAAHTVVLIAAQKP